MAANECSSKSRAFILLDSSAMSPGCLLWTQAALTRLGNTLAVSLAQPPPLGVAVMVNKPGQAAQLQILLRLGGGERAFQVREFLACVKRLQAGSSASACTATDGNMMGSALMALLSHMQKQPARADCHSHVFILAASLAGWGQHVKMHKVLQLVSLQRDCSLHFLQLAGPEAVDAAGALQGYSACAEGGRGATAAADDGAFADMLQALGDSVTHTSVMADGEAATDQISQALLRELLLTRHSQTQHTMPAHAAGGASSSTCPQLLLRFGTQTLPCSVQQHLLQLDPWLLPAHLCPCHGLPLLPPTGSSIAAAAVAASSGSDADSTAAALLLPEASPWACCVTRQPVGQPLAACATDASILQLSRHTQLRAAAGGAGVAAAAAAAAAAAGALAHGQPQQQRRPMEVVAQHMVPLGAIDSMLLFGMPSLLSPVTSSSSDVADDQQQQQDDSGAAATAAGGSSDAPMLMRALCQLLLEQQQVLVACARHDLLRRWPVPLLQWYMLQPAGDGSCLLARQMASREQLLPARPAAASSGGAGGAARADGAVVLLDAETLEAARVSLQGLGGWDPTGQLQPLLVSCGLDAWMASVMEGSTATYTPPPAPPHAAAGAAPDARVQLDTGAACAPAVMQQQVAGPAPTAAAAAGHRDGMHAVPHQHPTQVDGQQSAAATGGGAAGPAAAARAGGGVGAKAAGATRRNSSTAAAPVAAGSGRGGRKLRLSKV